MAIDKIHRDRSTKSSGESPVRTNPARRAVVNKLHFIVVNYLGKCCGGAFKNGRPVPAYFALKNFLKDKLTPPEVDTIYEYSLKAPKQPDLKFFQFANNAFEWNQQMNREHDLQARKVTQYKEYTIKDFMEWL